MRSPSESALVVMGVVMTVVVILTAYLSPQDTATAAKLWVWTMFAVVCTLVLRWVYSPTEPKE